MVKGKFVYIYADGSQMTDRNRYNTLAEAKSYVRSYNSVAKKSQRIIQVITKQQKPTPPKPKKTIAKRQNFNPLNPGFGF